MRVCVCLHAYIWVCVCMWFIHLVMNHSALGVPADFLSSCQLSLIFASTLSQSLTSCPPSLFCHKKTRCFEFYKNINISGIRLIHVKVFFTLYKVLKIIQKWTLKTTTLYVFCRTRSTLNRFSFHCFNNSIYQYHAFLW